MRKRVNALAEQLLETLEQQGYRSTSPRRAVAQVIANQGKHFTAEDLREKLPSLGRATIFRSLKLLVETGVLCRVLLEDGDLHSPGTPPSPALRGVRVVSRPVGL